MSVSITLNGKPITSREDLAALPEPQRTHVRAMLEHMLYCMTDGKEGVYSPEFEMNVTPKETDKGPR